MYFAVTGQAASRFNQPGLAFLQVVRLFDPQQAKLHNFDGFADAIPGAHSRVVRDEVAAYKLAAREVEQDVTPLAFWFANKDRFPNMFALAVRYLSVPTNSVDAERSVSQYTAINGPQRQSFTDANLAMHVKHAFNSKD